jgi:hypothetical protein
MTKKEINELVTEKIFGNRISTFVPAPPYCQDIYLAKNLLEYMELHNYAYNIYSADETLPILPRYNYQVEFFNLTTQQTYTGEAPTLEHAICVAALNALGYYKTDEVR